MFRSVGELIIRDTLLCLKNWKWEPALTSALHIYVYVAENSIFAIVDAIALKNSIELPVFPVKASTSIRSLTPGSLNSVFRLLAEGTMCSAPLYPRLLKKCLGGRTYDNIFVLNVFRRYCYLSYFTSSVLADKVERFTSCLPLQSEDTTQLTTRQTFNGSRRASTGIHRQFFTVLRNNSRNYC